MVNIDGKWSLMAMHKDCILTRNESRSKINCLFSSEKGYKIKSLQYLSIVPTMKDILCANFIKSKSLYILG